MKRLIKKISAITPEQYIQGYPNQYEHVEKGESSVDVNNIIGMTMGRNDEYDDNMQPIMADERWISLYEKAKQEKNLDFAGPVKLVKVPNEEKYFVYDDGNHRVSVAKALGIPYLRAVIVELIPKGLENNKEIEEEIKEIEKEIKEKNIKHQELTLKQQTIWDRKDLSFTEKDEEFDKIEEVARPLATEIDELWSKLNNLKSKLN